MCTRVFVVIPPPNYRMVCEPCEDCMIISKNTHTDQACRPCTFNDVVSQVSDVRCGLKKCLPSLKYDVQDELACDLNVDGSTGRIIDFMAGNIQTKLQALYAGRYWKAMWKGVVGFVPQVLHIAVSLDEPSIDWWHVSFAECCSMLQCVVVCVSMQQCVAACCSVLRCVAVCCGVLLFVVVCCSARQTTHRWGVLTSPLLTGGTSKSRLAGGGQHEERAEDSDSSSIESAHGHLVAHRLAPGEFTLFED